MYQGLAWQISLAAVLFIAAVFVFVVLRSGSPAEYGPIQNRFYQVRAVWFWALVIVAAAAAAVTLPDIPYGATHGRAGGPAPVAVNVTGYQWYWDMSRDAVPAGRTVELRITAADVNHGLAIYDPDGEIVTQAQAMPGYTNRIRHTFDEPGTYKLRCLEYCGIAHHEMVQDLRVTPAGG